METPKVLKLERAPEAKIEAVDDLVAMARRGRLRIPKFQRGLKWKSQDVCDLFDSIYRGLPIGVLLVWKRAAPAERVVLGPLAIDAEEMSDALWVVDGQQRLTTLAAGLSRSWPPDQSAQDPYVVYFDPRTQNFEPPPRFREEPSHWVPLPQLLDSAQLADWVHEWEHRGDQELRKRVFEAGKRLREYRVPMYVVETPDEATLEEIFFRVNKTGKPLEWSEVHDALFGNKGEVPSTTKDLADELEKLGLGRPDENEITNCLVAFRGKDVTRPLAEHIRVDREAFEGAANAALPALKSALLFLRLSCSIPHLQLLPRAWLLEPLTRFYALHPRPMRRSLELMTRWFWRTLLTTVEDRTLRRHAIAAIGEDEEQSVQALLALVSRDPVEVFAPGIFDFRTAESRIALVAMAATLPRHIEDGQVLKVPELIEAEQSQAFQSLYVEVPAPENWIIHPTTERLNDALRSRAEQDADDPVLASHLITPPAARALAAGNDELFLLERSKSLNRVIHAFAALKCGWGRNDRDRPSLKHAMKRKEG